MNATFTALRRLTFYGLVYIAALPSSAEAAFVAGTRFTIEALPEFGTSDALSINNRGQIAGGSLIRTDGEIFDIEASTGTLFGITDINDHGDAVGTTPLALDPENPGPPVFKPVLFRDGNVTMLPSLGTGPAAAGAINNRGEIVGWATPAENTGPFFPPNLTPRATVWRTPDEITTIATSIDSPDVRATDINDGGVIIGTTGSAFGSTDGGFKIEDGIVTSRPADEGFTRLHEVNILGNIIGTIANDAVLWPKGGDAEKFHHIHYSDRGAGFALNDSDVGVGIEFEFLIGLPEPTATLFFEGDSYRLKDFIDNLEAWEHLEFAHDINNANQIVGTGRLLSGERSHFLLTPQTIPEPSAALLLLLAAAIVTSKRRRRKN